MALDVEGVADLEAFEDDLVGVAEGRDCAGVAEGRLHCSAVLTDEARASTAYHLADEVDIYLSFWSFLAEGRYFIASSLGEGSSDADRQGTRSTAFIFFPSL